MNEKEEFDSLAERAGARYRVALDRLAGVDVDNIDYIANRMLGIMDTKSVGEWFETPVPALHSRTPLQTCLEGDWHTIHLLVSNYFESVY